MSRTDLIADAFTIIRNAAMVRKEETIIPFSNLLLKICDILKREGYIENFKEMETGSVKNIKVYLRYHGKKSAIRQIKKVSRPGRRVYSSAKDIPLILQGYGLAIVSTSQNILTDKEAREKGVGGEILGTIW